MSQTPDEINDVAGSRYRELMGSLQYAYAVNKLSQFLANPRRVHLNAACQSSKGRNTEDSTLEEVSQTSLTFRIRIGDAITTNMLEYRVHHHILAGVFRLGLGEVSWKSRNQTSVALSTAESEYMAMFQAAIRTFRILLSHSFTLSSPQYLTFVPTPTQGSFST